MQLVIIYLLMRFPCFKTDLRKLTKFNAIYDQRCDEARKGEKLERK
jgi:hypothetical protein